MTHKRITPEGQQLGKFTANLSAKGNKRLLALGLANLNAPMLRKEMCRTCACRPGVVPNGCAKTQLDFLKAAVEGLPFRCHAPNDGRMCAGWVQVRAEIVANPIPIEFAAILKKHEYSPPD